MSPLALSFRFLQAQPDSRLIALAQAGHEPAFEALVRRYHKELLAYCRRLQPRSGGAEDALQQTLLQAWRALTAGAEVRNARPWLYRIAHNVSLNQVRIAVPLPQDVVEEAGGHEVHQLVEQRLQARAALAGMASLPTLQRDAFVSTTLNGASHEEVASALGLSSGAVRGLIYRARTTLRSAAAAIIPSPAVHWALRRIESRPAGASMVGEVLAGGGGAGMAAALAKGSALLTVAGALAGASGVILTTHSAVQHPRHAARSVLVGGAAGPRPHSLLAQVNAAATQRSASTRITGIGAPHTAIRRPSRPATAGRLPISGPAARERGSRVSGPSGADGNHSRDRSEGGSLPGGSDGGPRGTSSSDGSNGSTGGSSSDGRDGGSPDGNDGGLSGTSGGSTSTGSGSGDGGPGAVSGTQLTAGQATSDGGTGTDGGSVSSSPSSSGSAETTTTDSQ